MEVDMHIYVPTRVIRSAENPTAIDLSCSLTLLRRNEHCKMSRDMTKQQSECAPSKDSDQPGHAPSLFRVFAVRLMGN